jgi:uncharacterized RDD family membrane protein YckC
MRALTDRTAGAVFPADSKMACVFQSIEWRSPLHPTDKLLIDTPEQIALELPLAGIRSRSLALAVDSLLQIGAIILMILLLLLSKLSGSSLITGIGAILIAIVPFLIQWGYFTLFEIFWNGQTPGKRVAQIRVINESVSVIHFSRRICALFAWQYL